jgi:transposase
LGLIVPQGIGHIATRVPSSLKMQQRFAGSFRLLVQRLLDHLKELDRQVEELEAQIMQWHRQQRCSAANWHKIPASALSRPAHWLHRSVMRRTSTEAGRSPPGWAGAPAAFQGGKSEPAGYQQTRRHIPAHLVDSRRALGDLPRRSSGPTSCSWINSVVIRRNKNVAAVALANKNARIAWALLGA